MIRFPVRWAGSRRARGAVLVGLLLVVVSVWAATRSRDERRTVEETVQQFFGARRAGDCEALADLVTVPGGARSDDRPPVPGFDEACVAVVQEYQPALEAVEIVSDDGNRAVVNVSIPDEEPSFPSGRSEGLVVEGSPEGTAVYNVGHLIREGGEWRVVIDNGFLRLGRSVEQTVRAFVDGYHDSDCERIADYVTERVWSAEGLSRAEYIDQCVASQAGVAPVITLPDAIEVTIDPDDPDSARAQWDSEWVGVGPEIGVDPEDQVMVPPDGSLVARDVSEDVALVRDGLAWKLDSPLDAFGQLLLAARLLVEALPGYHRVQGPEAPWTLIVRGPRPLYGGDTVERRSEAGFEGAIGAVFQPDTEAPPEVVVSVLEFADQEGARAYAELLAARIGQQADPESPAPVPSVADARGAVISCESDDEGCQHASAAAAVGATGRWMVVAEAYDATIPTVPTSAELLARAEEVLRAQLDRL